MIVTWGQPTNYSTFTSFSTSSWDECVVHCYQLSSCVLAHSPLHPVDCKILTVNRIWEVKKLNSSSGLLVAFRVTDSQGQTCPIGDNAPTFGNETVYGTASNSIANYSYTISYSSGDTWQFDYYVFPNCPVGWTQFTRPLTTWCLQAFGGPTDLYVYADAVSLCESLDSVLSGLETTDERNFVAGKAIELLGASYPEFGGWWVSGVRKPECYASGWQGYSHCTGTNMQVTQRSPGDYPYSTIQQFTFTDTYLTNYAGYTWDPYQPDRNAAGSWQNCIQLWIRNQAIYPDFNYTAKANGNADDTWCNSNGTTGDVMRGLVCGRLPEVPAGA